MSFLFPLALGLSLLALAVVALSGRRRRRIVVPGVLLWQRLAHAGTSASPAWRLPPMSLPLILQILAIVLLALALARPWIGGHRDVDHWIVVFDNSAPISLVENGVPRFEAAKDQLHTFMASGTGENRFSLITTNGRAEPLAARLPFSPHFAQAAIDPIALGQANPDWAGVADILPGIVRAEEASRIVLISAAPPPLDTLGTQAEITLIAIGTPVANAALEAHLIPVAPETGQWHIEGLVRHADMAPPDAIAVTFTPPGGQAAALAEIEPRPGEEPGTAAFALDLDLPGPGMVELALQDDAGAFDNTNRFIVRDAPRTRAVLHIGGPDQPLAAALAAIEGVAVIRSDAMDDTLGGFDLLVVSDPAIASPPGVITLRLEPGGAPGNWRILDWNPTHPLSRGIDWSGLVVEAATPLEVRNDETVILASENGALITASQSGPTREIRIGFDPAASNWPDGVALPIFAANLIDGLGPRPGGWLEPLCTLGTPCRIDSGLVGGTATPVEGSAAPQTLDTGHFDPAQAGLYRLENGDRTAIVAVNPAPAAPLAGQDPAFADTDTQWPWELAPWLIGLVLLVLLIEAAVAWRNRERGPWLALRGAVLALAMTALLDPLLPLPGGIRPLVWVADAPGPVPQTGGVVSAGMVWRDIDGNQAQAPAASHGDGDVSLRIAAAMLPPSTDGVVALRTNAPAPALGATAADLARRGITLDAIAPDLPAGAVSIEQLSAPAPLYAGDTFTLTSVLHATDATRAQLTLNRDGTPVLSRAIDLAPGANRVDLELAAPQPGPVHYELAVETDGQAMGGNGRMGLWRDVAPAPSIAVIASDEEPRVQFAAMLAGQGFEAVALSPDTAPANLPAWREYDGIVLLDLEAIALGIRKISQIEMAVRDHGLGLLIAGGAHSFGPGGYLETPLEDLSPLSSRLPHDTPEVALVFVIDSSGSMTQTVGAQTRLDIAKQAVRSAIDLLDGATSSVGVVMFNAIAETALALQPVPDAQTVDDALAAVQPGGGTAIYPGLLTAYEQLLENDAGAKHIVIMTDGMSDPADFPFLLGRIRDAGITVSAVAIGSTALTNIAEDIALMGGGRFHATEDFEALPSILSQEALMLAGEAIEQGSFPLLAGGDRPAYMAGLPQLFPPVEGFVKTTAKPRADIVWTLDAGDDQPTPLLASWRYGTGNVLALATAVTGRWTQAWQENDDYPRLFAQALRQFLPARAPEPIALDIGQSGDRVEIVLTAFDTRGTPLSPPPALRIDAEDGTAISPALTEIAPGFHRAGFIPAHGGTHEVVVEGTDPQVRAAFDVAFPSALSFRHEAGPLTALAATTGGQWVGAGEPYAAGPATQGTRTLLRPLWLALALGLFMLELIWRRTLR